MTKSKKEKEKKTGKVPSRHLEIKHVVGAPQGNLWFF